MKLFYLKEHLSCFNYAKFEAEGFSYYKLEKGTMLEEETTKDTILFVLKGNILFDYDGDSLVVRTDEMIFVRRKTIVGISMQEDVEIVVAMFNSGVQACQKASFSVLYQFKGKIKYSMKPLKIHDRMKKFMELLVCYIGDGVNCIHFHELKLRELFWIFRFYYPKMEQASFFYTVISDDHDFKNLVLENYKDNINVKELADSCRMSVSTFKRKFHLEFGQSASSWLQKQMLGKIRYKLTDTDLTLSDIADQLNFSSLSQFSRYCKRFLAASPLELRKNIQKRE